MADEEPGLPDDEPGPSIRRRQLGRQLRELRIAAGFKTIAAAAERSGLSTATISRIEAAKQVILPKTVLTLCRAYDIGAPVLDHLLRLAKESDDQGWLLEYSETVPNWFQRYAREEADASEILTYQSEYVPGLFQIEEYAQALTFASQQDVSRERSADVVAFRRRRQERLDSEKPPRIAAVVNEGAVRRLVGGPDVMRKQLQHLVEMARRPNIAIQVLPFSAGAHPAMTSAFTVLNFPGGISDLYVEVPGGALYPDRPSDFEHFAWMIERLRALALSTDNTIALLTSLVEELNPGE